MNSRSEIFIFIFKYLIFDFMYFFSFFVCLYLNNMFQKGNHSSISQKLFILKCKILIFNMTTNARKNGIDQVSLTLVQDCLRSLSTNSLEIGIDILLPAISDGFF